MKKIEDEFVDYPLSLRMKTLGFNGPCMVYFDNKVLKRFDPSFLEAQILNSDFIEKDDYCTAPTWQSAFDWFSENHDLWSNIDRIFKDEYGYTITPGSDEPINVFNIDSHNEAKIDCLTKLIEIVEQKEK